MLRRVQVKLIYDTNLRTARAHGQWQRIQRSKKAMPYLKYEIGPSKEHRKEHVQWNWLCLPADDPFWDTHYPQNGWGCKCRVRQVSQFEYDRMNKSGKIGTRAPTIKRRDYINERTGEISRVPNGIDPGWDYNPGKGRLTELSKTTTQKQKAARKTLSQPLPDHKITAPEPFSTARNVQGAEVNRVLNELGDHQSRQLFDDFLKAHPIKTVMAKATEIGGKKARQNQALQAQIADYLGVSPDEAFRQYGTARSVTRTLGFTGTSREVITVKVKANSDLRKADSGKIRESVTTAIKAATENNGKYRSGENLYRVFSICDTVGQNTPEQLMTTMIHEMGHQVHFRAGAPRFPTSLKTVLTRYSAQDDYEWFAEHFAAWYIDPQGVRQWSSEAADFIETTLKEATKNQNPRLKGR